MREYPQHGRIYKQLSHSLLKCPIAVFAARASVTHCRNIFMQNSTIVRQYLVYV
jgi:hypothetical protein